MATQNFQRNLLLHLYQDGEKKPQPSLVSCLLRERKKRLTLAVYFLCLETPGLPACYPLTVRQSVDVMPVIILLLM